MGPDALVVPAVLTVSAVQTVLSALVVLAAPGGRCWPRKCGGVSATLMVWNVMVMWTALVVDRADGRCWKGAEGLAELT